MASQLPCAKNDVGGYTFYVSLVPQADTRIFQANPTLAAGDVKIAIDDGAPANLGTLPAVDADFTKRVKVVLAQAEINGDNLTIIFSDAAGSEWCDLTINIQTAAQTFDATDAVVDTALVDTNELQTDWHDGGRLDLLIDAIKAKSDNLPADPADDSDIDAQLAAIVTAVNRLYSVSGCGDADSPVAGSFAETLRWLRHFAKNEWRIDETASPDTFKIYKDDGVTESFGFTVYTSSSINYRDPA